jgi:hypothetical protein
VIGAFKTILPDDISINPFYAHKEWVFTGNEISSSLGTYIAKYVPNTVSFYSSSSEIINGKYTRLLYNSINTTFYNNELYKFKTHPLFFTTSILSIPQIRYGERIKPGSFNYYSGYYSSSVKDNSDGKLYIGSVPVEDTTYISNNKRTLFIGLNNILDYNNQVITSSTTNEESSLYLKTQYNNIKITESINRFGSYFNTQQSYIRVSHDELNNFKTDDNFTIFFTIRLDSNYTSSVEYSDIISKNITREFTNLPNPSKYTYPYSNIVNDSKVTSYPYKVSINNNTRKIYFSRYDGEVVSTVTSSISLPSSSYQYVSCIKSGSNLSIYFNTSSVGTISDNSTLYTTNNCDVFVGINGDLSSNQLYNTTLSDIQIFSTPATVTELQTLVTYPDNNVFIGDIFYQQGIAVINNTKYVPTIFSQSTHTDILTYKSSLLLYDNNIRCTVGENEFNDTYNPSLRIEKNSNSVFLQPFATSSTFTPYITTIGLYNDNLELLAVGKTSFPVRSSAGTDLTFIVTYDT